MAQDNHFMTDETGFFDNKNNNNDNNNNTPTQIHQPLLRHRNDRKHEIVKHLSVSSVDSNPKPTAFGGVSRSKAFDDVDDIISSSSSHSHRSNSKFFQTP
mmetsp:Transcript_4712/g.12003  ORF Transcript_4712/g.12003 Transcript_4712/m.12003 type:complete len:100 (+) Transcript_4712:2-301(+)